MASLLFLPVAGAMTGYYFSHKASREEKARAGTTGALLMVSPEGLISLGAPVLGVFSGEGGVGLGLTLLHWEL